MLLSSPALVLQRPPTDGGSKGTAWLLQRGVWDHGGRVTLEEVYWRAGAAVGGCSMTGVWSSINQAFGRASILMSLRPFRPYRHARFGHEWPRIAHRRRLPLIV